MMIWAFHTCFVSLRMLSLKVRARERLWLQYPTDIHDVMLSKKYHTSSKSLILKERSLSNYYVIFHSEYKPREREKNLSEGFSFLNQPACNSQCIKTDSAFQDSLKPVTNKGIFTTKPDSLLTGFKCGC